MPGQPSRREPRQRRADRGNYRDLIHHLNRRYHLEWERAERLEVELARARRWGLWPVVELLRRLKRWLRPPATDLMTGVLPWPYRPLIETVGRPHGRVSIVIPFKDRAELLRNCLRSLRLSTYRRIEVVLVNNGSEEPRTQRYLWHLEGRRGIRVVDCPGPFNFSRLCNEGARRAAGDHLLFLNNDTEVLTPDWLERLLLIERHPEVGAVGATLVYPDRTIQHAGIFPHRDGRWIHVYRGRPLECEGAEGELRHVRAVPAVTAACLLMRREQFAALGGFDERLPLTFGDVDLCRRVREEGRLVVVTPHARLVHYESLTRGYALDEPPARAQAVGL
jgi:O-antigen biosynthesis protein